MEKKSRTVRYTAKQIKAKIARGEDRTDWPKADRATGKRLEKSIRADADDVHAGARLGSGRHGRPGPERSHQYPPRSRYPGVVQGTGPRISNSYEQRLARFRAIATGAPDFQTQIRIPTIGNGSVMRISRSLASTRPENSPIHTTPAVEAFGTRSIGSVSAPTRSSEH